MATLEDHLPLRKPDAVSLAVELRTSTGLLPYLPDHLPIFIKMNAEGHDAVVTQQLLASPLADRVISIFYEHDPKWSDGAAIADTLARAGFAVMCHYGRGWQCDALALPVPAA